MHNNAEKRALFSCEMNEQSYTKSMKQHFFLTLFILIINKYKTFV